MCYTNVISNLLSSVINDESQGDGLKNKLVIHSQTGPSWNYSFFPKHTPVTLAA